MELLLLVPIFLQASFQPRPGCWPEPRDYHPSDQALIVKEEFAPRTTLARVAGRLPQDRTVSPNKAYAFHHREDVGADGARTAVLRVFTEADNLLELRIRRVLAWGEVKWVNEKLLYARVWLGRLVGVDVIVDVERDVMVSTETVNHGRIAWEQYRELCTGSPKARDCTDCKTAP